VKLFYRFRFFRTRFSRFVDDALIIKLILYPPFRLPIVFSYILRFRSHQVRGQRSFCSPSEALNFRFEVSRESRLAAKPQEIDTKQPACVVRDHSRGEDKGKRIVSGDFGVHSEDAASVCPSTRAFIGCSNKPHGGWRRASLPSPVETRASAASVAAALKY